MMLSATRKPLESFLEKLAMQRTIIPPYFLLEIADSMNGPEFRTDPLTGLKVLIAPARSSRPFAIHPEPSLNRNDDPFAEGCEAETPHERFAIRETNSPPDGRGWKLRVVPNRYPAMMASQQIDETQGPLSGSDFFPAQPACGEHDVVIECPDSRARLTEFSTVEIARIFSAWQARLRQLAQVGEYCHVSIFRNEGFSAGASLSHCHSQIIASQHSTPLDTERYKKAKRYYQSTGRELTLDLLQAELQSAKRIVLQSDRFVVLCPFASRTSWHLRFVPHATTDRSFLNADQAVTMELAELVKTMLKALEQALGGPFSFNLILPHPRLNQPEQFRWMLELMPRTGRSAGWEFLTGVDIVTVAPEQAATVLRQYISQPQT